MRKRGWWIAGVAAIAAASAMLAYMHGLALADPVVRQLRYAAPGWPAGTPPLRIVLLTDLHVHDLGASRARIARVVRQANALAPDIVLLGGDLVGGSVQDRPAETPDALAPLRALRPRLGSVAVLGNHDHWSEPERIRAALRAMRITVLDNAAVRLGPLTIGGVDDVWTHHADVPRTLAAMRALGRPSILLSHGPDVFADQRVTGLVLAGHTHCGQVVLPLLGAIAVPLRQGRRYVCGVFREPGRMLVVSAGIGTSRLAVRLGAPPDLWLIEIGS